MVLLGWKQRKYKISLEHFVGSEERKCSKSMNTEGNIKEFPKAKIETT